MLFQSFLKNSFSFLFASLLFISTGFSQSTSYLDSLDGKFALQFQINENFSLSSFQGTIFSGKYNFSNRDAVRLGLSINLGDTEGDETTSRPDTNLVTTKKEENSNFNIIIKTQYIYSMSITNDIGFFVGGGPFVQYSNSTSEVKWTNIPIVSSSTYTSDRFGIGLDIINGVEWVFYKNMSLSAEYGLKFTYLSTEEKRVRNSISDNTTSESKRKSYLITGNHINFGITVYF